MKKSSRNPEATRKKLLAAAVKLILRQGYAATSVDDVCHEAGVTKGSFFHHFENKEAMGREAVVWWSQMGTALYAKAWENPDGDPLDQLHAMLGIMEGFASRPEEPCVCIVGMMSQELAGSNPDMRDLCGQELAVWTANTARLLAAAKVRHRPARDFDPEAVAWFLNSIWQGSMLLAKTQQNQGLILANLRQARSHIDSLFTPSPKTRKSPS